ncbi:hypothetical protein PInf_024382 [Phytophthora infestans]|nr:hypothetical protein PInf_024382 [Phytophthora infestans]
MSNIRLRRPSGATDAHAPPTSNFRSSGWENALVAASSVVSGSDGLPYDLVETSKETTPLLVFINSRSGGKMGLHVLRQVRMWLNPLQVHDLSHQSPIEPLRRFIGLPRLRILVCGGDGTVGWVLGALDEIGAQRQPPIAVLPLGTGNDLARVLGWGAGFSAPTDVSEILSEVEAAHVSLLDRWQVNIGDSQKRVVLNNYVGVGVDAQVALEFHEQRERSPGLFMSQFVNKLWYSQFGAKNFLVLMVVARNFGMMMWNLTMKTPTRRCMGLYISDKCKWDCQKPTVEERDVVTKKVGEVLDWAEHSHVITSTQRDVLLVEIARRVADSAASRRPAGSRAILSTDRANGSHSFVSDR